MWKKTLLALATVVALAGFGSLVEATPAAAQGMHHRPPIMHAPPPRHWGGGPHVVPRGYYHTPRHRWGGPSYGFRSTVRVYPPGVYGYYGYSDCRIVRKRVRVWTDYGWRFRLRNVRYCG